MKTRETIEAVTSGENPTDASGKTPKVQNPRSLANLVAPWTSETAPRNGGRPKKDFSQDIARKAFENNQEEIYKSYVELLLKGSAFGFQVLAERAYGKLKETRDTGAEFNEVLDSDLAERVEQLERDLYPAIYPVLTREASEAAGTGSAKGGTQKANGKAKDSDVLPGNGAAKARTLS